MKFYFAFVAMLFICSCGNEITEQSEAIEINEDTLDEQVVVDQLPFELLDQYDDPNSDSIEISIISNVDDKVWDKKHRVDDSLLHYFDVSDGCNYDGVFALYKLSINDSLTMLLTQVPMECYAHQIRGFVYNKKQRKLIPSNYYLAAEFGDAGEEMHSSSLCVLKNGYLNSWLHASHDSYQEPDSEEPGTESYYYSRYYFENGEFLEGKVDTTLQFFKRFRMSY